MTTTLQSDIRGEPALDGDAFAVLASERRRIVLQCLLETDGPIARADLAGEVAARERDVDVDEVPDETIERVHASLYHVHVPKLADQGLLHYDEERTTVVPSDDAESLAPILEWTATGTE